MKKKVSLLLASLILCSGITVYAQEMIEGQEQNEVESSGLIDTWYYEFDRRQSRFYHEPDPSDLSLAPRTAVEPFISDEERIASLSDEEREAREARLQEEFEFWSNPDNYADLLRERYERYGEPQVDVRRSLRWTDLPNFRHFPQEQGNTCGPASVRMVLFQRNGWAPTELSIQQSVNRFPLIPSWPTAFEFRYARPMADFLRSELGFAYFVDFAHNTDQRLLSYNISRLVTHFQRPSIIGVVASQANGWEFTIPTHLGEPRHWAVISGVRHTGAFDADWFAIADPWGGSPQGGWGFPARFDLPVNRVHQAFSATAGGGHGVGMGYMW